MSLQSFKDILFPQSESTEGKAPLPKMTDTFNAKRLVTFHGRLIKFYEMSIEDAESIGEEDYVRWLKIRLEKEQRVHLKRKQYVQERNFQNTLDKFKSESNG